MSAVSCRRCARSVMGAVCSCFGGDSRIEEEPRNHGQSRAPAYAVPHKKILDFGYRKDFLSLFHVGRELGKGQYGTTFQ